MPSWSSATLCATVAARFHLKRDRTCAYREIGIRFVGLLSLLLTVCVVLAALPGMRMLIVTSAEDNDDQHSLMFAFKLML